jgi:hypothetical protein
MDVSGVARLTAYGACAIVCAAVGVRERRQARDADATRSVFWFATAVVLAALGVATAGDLGQLLADAGRREAAQHGWYGVRRSYQAAAVAALGGVWIGTLAVAVLRAPERHRRYIPVAASVATLLAFDALRTISLHQVDWLLYRHEVGGLRIASAMELALILAVVVTVVAVAQRHRPARP